MRYSLALLALIPSALAHGYVDTLKIAGKSYTGNLPQAPKKASVIRQVGNTEPIKGTNNPDINCGRAASLASLVADAQPGDKVSFDWKGGDDGSNWPHQLGPMLTYMASCGDQTCDKFKSASAKWFKIDQVDYRADGQWKQVDLNEGKVATVTIPPTLAPGNYLIRHEIIALHLADQKGGVEFYPSCSQLRVGGSQTGVPSASELVSFPGAYNENDKGILVNVFNGKLKYAFPGPAIAKLNGAGGVSSPTSSAVSSASPRPTSTSVRAPAASGSSVAVAQPVKTALPSTVTPVKSCKLKKRVAAAPVVKRETLRRHAMNSRVMARLHK